MRRDVSPLLPAADFRRPRINALVRVRCPDPVEACLSMRPFARRQRQPVSQPATAAALNAPGLHLRSNLQNQTGPVRQLRSGPRLGFLCPARRVQHETPVARFYLETPRSFPSLRSPPGSLDPSGSKRSARFRLAKLTLAGCPIFLRSPPRGDNYSSQHAADQCSGSATSRQARCPSNLLEPGPECTQTRTESSENGAFPQETSPLYTIS